MPIAKDKNIYTIPKGNVFFDPWNASEQVTGEVPFGNCPDVNISIKADKAKHYSAQAGLAEVDDSWNKSVERSGKITCDNMAPRVVVMWLSGAESEVSQANTAVTGELRQVLPGRHYQLGATAQNPVGVRNVTDVTVKDEDGTTPYDAGVDYEVDTETGRIKILEGGGIVAGTVTFGYKPVNATYTSMKSGSAGELIGALRIVSDNPKGGNKDWYMPKVSLTPTGDMTLITTDGDKPVSMEFEIEILKPTNGEAMYCNGRPIAIP